MLRALELYLLPIVDAALAGSVDVERGPSRIPSSWPSNQQTVVVYARRLDVRDTPPPKTSDVPAFVTQLASWTADGVTDSFTLPIGIEGVILEVESPEGIVATEGDDYYVEDSTILFYVAPAGPGDVRARVRTADASGYARRRPCTITLDVSALSEDIDDIDERLEDAVQIVLVALHDAPYFVSDETTGLGSTMRFIDFRTHLAWIERTDTGEQDVYSAVARLELEGVLDVVIPTGDPQPQGVISQLEGEITIEGGEEAPVPFPITIEDPAGGGP